MAKKKVKATIEFIENGHGRLINQEEKKAIINRAIASGKSVKKVMPNGSMMEVEFYG